MTFIFTTGNKKYNHKFLGALARLNLHTTGAAGGPLDAEGAAPGAPVTKAATRSRSLSLRHKRQLPTKRPPEPPAAHRGPERTRKLEGPLWQQVELPRSNHAQGVPSDRYGRRDLDHTSFQRFGPSSECCLCLRDALRQGSNLSRREGRTVRDRKLGGRKARS